MKKNYITTILCILSLSLSGCLSTVLKPEVDPTVFYVLKETPVEAKSDVVLNMNISPITIPAYMDKGQIVSLGAGNKLSVSEFNRWGEPLSGAVIRTFYLDMMNNLDKKSKLYSYPLFVFDNKLPTLTVSIFELSGTMNGESKIKATWALGNSSTDKLLADGVFEKSVSNGKGYAGYVDSLSELLSDLSADIVSKLGKK